MPSPLAPCLSADGRADTIGRLTPLTKGLDKSPRAARHQQSTVGHSPIQRLTTLLLLVARTGGSQLPRPYLPPEAGRHLRKRSAMFGSGLF